MKIVSGISVTKVVVLDSGGKYSVGSCVITLSFAHLLCGIKANPKKSGQVRVDLVHRGYHIMFMITRHRPKGKYNLQLGVYTHFV